MEPFLGRSSSNASQRREAAAARIAEAMGRAERAHARAAVILVQAPAEEAAGEADEETTEGAAERLARVLGDWERLCRGRTHVLPWDRTRHLLILAPIGFASHAREVCDHIVCAVHRHRCGEEREALPRLVFGTAIFPDDGIDAAELLARAESRLDSMLDEGRALSESARWSASLSAAARAAGSAAALP